MYKKFYNSKRFWGLLVCFLSFIFNWMEVLVDLDFFNMLDSSQRVKLIGSGITFTIGFLIAMSGAWGADKKLEI